MDEKEMIIAELKRHGIDPTPGTGSGDTWSEEDGRPVVTLDGQWEVLADDEDRGLYEGDPGRVSATVVGATEYNNVRAIITFTPDANDPGTGVEVIPFDDVEPVG